MARKAGRRASSRRKETSAPKPASARMLDLIIGYWVSKLVYVAARLDLADRLCLVNLGTTGALSVRIGDPM